MKAAKGTIKNVTELMELLYKEAEDRFDFFKIELGNFHGDMYSFRKDFYKFRKDMYSFRQEMQEFRDQVIVKLQRMG
ncbi:MAG: hypothetical protein ABIO02_03640 [Patescibacteria group bacterium]